MAAAIVTPSTAPVYSTMPPKYISFDDLAARRLVAPFAPTVPKGQHWYLVYQQTRLEEPGFAAFRGWLMQTTRAQP
jgi:DNA-binding transcriptional LysR family regulator